MPTGWSGQPTEMLTALETDLCSAWSLFGSWSRAKLHHGPKLLWYESEIPYIPYNGVLRTHIDDSAELETAIQSLVRHFRYRNAQMFWMVSPLSEPPDLAERLIRNGFSLVQELTGMAMGLRQFPPVPLLSEGVTIRQVSEPATVEDYIQLQTEAWHLPDSTRALLREMHRTAVLQPGQLASRWLAYDDDRPVGKTFTHESMGIVGVYGVLVLPQVRGRGIATSLVATALHAARARGCHLAVLHSSEVARSLYRRMGFQEYGPFRPYVPGLSFHV